MTWQLLVFISIIAYSLSVLLQRMLMKEDKSDPVAYSILFQLLVGIIIFLFAMIRGFHMPDVTGLLPNYLIMVVLYGLGNICIFRSLKEGGAAEFTIAFTTRTIWSIGAAVIFLGESFTGKQAVGTVFILISVIILTFKNSLFSINKSMIFAFGGAAALGLAFVNDAYILRSTDVPSYLSLAFIAPALFMWLLHLRTTKHIRIFLNIPNLKKLFFLAVLYAIAAISIFLAYQIGRNAAQIAPINQTSTIVIVLLAIVFLREKNDLSKKMVGTILSMIGVMLLV